MISSFTYLLSTPAAVASFLNLLYRAVKPVIAPPGAPTVGMWVEDRHCGLATWLIAIVGAFPCAYFCPCDRRTVWVSGGVKVRLGYDNEGEGLGGVKPSWVTVDVESVPLTPGFSNGSLAWNRVGVGALSRNFKISSSLWNHSSAHPGMMLPPWVLVVRWPSESYGAICIYRAVSCVPRLPIAIVGAHLTTGRIAVANAIFGSRECCDELSRVFFPRFFSNCVKAPMLPVNQNSAHYVAGGSVHPGALVTEFLAPEAKHRPEKNHVKSAKLEIFYGVLF